MEGTIVAIHSLGFMIKPDDGTRDIYFGLADPHEAGWQKHQRVTFTLDAPMEGEAFRKAATVQLVPDPAN